MISTAGAHLRSEYSIVNLVRITGCLHIFVYVGNAALTAVLWPRVKLDEPFGSILYLMNFTWMGGTIRSDTHDQREVLRRLIGVRLANDRQIHTNVKVHV